MPQISAITSREILDSRATPTLETTVFLDNGVFAVASVPSGASTGLSEAYELRDGDQKRFKGKGVLKAIQKITQEIAPKIIGIEATDQKKLDQTLINLDSTQNKSNIGGNSILSVSVATCKAAAYSLKMPLYKYIAEKLIQETQTTTMPTPVFNCINGGKHGAGNLDFQEFHLIPSSSKPFSLALQIGAETYYAVKNVLVYRGAIHSVGDEGGFAPNLFTNLDALEVFLEAIKQTPYRFNQDVFLGLDIASSYFYKDGVYKIKDRSQPFHPDEFIEYYKVLNDRYQVLYLEDPLYEDDFNSWSKLTKEIGENTIIVGDDLLCTNKTRLQKAIDARSCNAILIKPNQIGTVSETIDVVKQAKKANIKTIASHRSGETNDDFIADFAVGVQADYVKFGAPARGERVAKYNRLLSIELEINQ